MLVFDKLNLHFMLSNETLQIENIFYHLIVVMAIFLPLHIDNKMG